MLGCAGDHVGELSCLRRIGPNRARNDVGVALGGPAGKDDVVVPEPLTAIERALAEGFLRFIQLTIVSITDAGIIVVALLSKYQLTPFVFSAI